MALYDRYAFPVCGERDHRRVQVDYEKKNLPASTGTGLFYSAFRPTWVESGEGYRTLVLQRHRLGARIPPVICKYHRRIGDLSMNELTDCALCFSLSYH